MVTIKFVKYTYYHRGCTYADERSCEEQDFEPQRIIGHIGKHIGDHLRTDTHDNSGSNIFYTQQTESYLS